LVLTNGDIIEFSEVINFAQTLKSSMVEAK